MAARDPLGVRPLCLGRSRRRLCCCVGDLCALDHIGADLGALAWPARRAGDDRPPTGVTSEQVATVESGPSACVFEHIYFARPDSTLDGKLVYAGRIAMGAQLAREHPTPDAVLVIGVPDSASAAAIGYARESGISYADGLVKNRYVGRTFIQPDQRLRELGVSLKFNPLREVIEGKRLVVVDDSIVRGTTTPRVIHLLRDAGAAAIHMRICAPPIMNACFFGVDMATRGELIAAQRTVDEIRAHIGADSLGFLSIEGLIRAVGIPKERHCLACFTGGYPVPVQLEMDKLAFERTTEGIDEDSPHLVANVAVRGGPVYDEETRDR